ncbi:MAG: FG-GAP-like repeat-containing protein [Granulosicoccus sp.]
MCKPGRLATLFCIGAGLLLQACNSDDGTSLPISVAGDTGPISGITTRLFEPSSFIRIASGEGGFEAELESGDRFARDHDNAGDINGDGVTDLIIGARSDDDGATDAGAVYILFMNANGTVNSSQKISALEGNFTDELLAGDFFGYGVAGIGDYNGDGTPDVAVSAPSPTTPAVYILHLNTDGTVKSMVKNTNIMGFGLSSVGDLNNDGRVDLVAADPNAINGGRIRLLFFNQDSSLAMDDVVTIGEGLGGFGSGINAEDSFGGRESALLGDLDNDGTLELAVGAFESDNGLGAIWILSLDPNTHEVVDKTKIAPGLAGFDETIELATNANGTTGSHFGHALVAAGDLNGDSVPDLISSANQYNAGVGYVLYLNQDKTVESFTRINSTEGGFDLSLQNAERFGRSISIVDSNRAEGAITINMGGGAGTTGVLYALQFQACTYTNMGEDMFWSEGVTAFSNWDHGTQNVTGPLDYEQCSLKAAQVDAPNITFKEQDGRCIIKNASATLSFSNEGSTAYTRSCPLVI